MKKRIAPKTVAQERIETFTQQKRETFKVSLRVVPLGLYMPHQPFYNQANTKNSHIFGIKIVSKIEVLIPQPLESQYYTRFFAIFVLAVIPFLSGEITKI